MPKPELQNHDHCLTATFMVTGKHYMFSGINEILLVAAIVLAIIFIPRMTASRNTGRPRVPSRPTPGFALSGRLRLAIIVSLSWVAFWAVYFEPWQKEWKLFIYIGPGPILIIWGTLWVMQGVQSRSNR